MDFFDQFFPNCLHFRRATIKLDFRFGKKKSCRGIQRFSGFEVKCFVKQMVYVSRPCRELFRVMCRVVHGADNPRRAVLVVQLRVNFDFLVHRCVICSKLDIVSRCQIQKYLATVHKNVKILPRYTQNKILLFVADGYRGQNGRSSCWGANSD